MIIRLEGQYRHGIQNSSIVLSSGRTSLDITVLSKAGNKEEIRATVTLSTSQIDALISVLQAIQKEQDER